MTKHEIIEILEKCLADYENAVKRMKLYDIEYQLTIVESLSINKGFCLWLNSNNFILIGTLIFKELKKDLIQREDIFYWYEVFHYTLDYNTSLIPRIEHLKRTINRLKTEIQNDTNN